MKTRLLSGVAYLVAAVEYLLRPPQVESVSLFDALDAPHPQPCIEPVWAVLDGERRLSLVPLSDGRMAVFAADLEDFCAVMLDRSQVQNLRHCITGWLCDSAAVIR